MNIKRKWSDKSGVSRRLSVLLVRSQPGQKARGRILVPGHAINCALGPGGISHFKREGDGRTPAGRWRFHGGYARADRVTRPVGWLTLTRRHWGWCDAAGANYNRRVDLPCAASHELLWRDDFVYDVVVVLDYNLTKRRQGRGSAIFFHIARENFPPTAGCVAIRLEDMRRLLPRLAKNCVMVVK